jgi:phosphoribosyl 1,2-cyclic phosphodiesterase
MRLVALGSGSKGNAFALDTVDGVLLLDAGFSARELTRRAGGAGLDLDRLVGIALTHEHGDHAAGARRLARRFGVPIAGTEGTLRALRTRGMEPDQAVTLRSTSLAELGPFTIGVTRILHDAAEPAALAVEWRGARVGLAYDFGRPTMGLRYLFRRLDAVILEANYDEVMLRTSHYPPSVQHRIAGSGGHLSNSAAADLLGDLVHPGLAVVVLAHLSRQCNEPAAARGVVEPRLRARGFRGRLEVAVQDRALEPIAIPERDPASQLEIELPDGDPVMEELEA